MRRTGDSATVSHGVPAVCLPFRGPFTVGGRSEGERMSVTLDRASIASASRRPAWPRGHGFLVQRLLFLVGQSFRQLLHVVLVRYLVAFVRYAYYVGLRRRLRRF